MRIDNKVLKDNPIISYLMFADDCITFYKASTKQTRTVKVIRLLQCLGPIGQLHESVVQFSKGTENRQNHDTVDILQIERH